MLKISSKSIHKLSLKKLRYYLTKLNKKNVLLGPNTLPYMIFSLQQNEKRKEGTHSSTIVILLQMLTLQSHLSIVNLTLLQIPALREHRLLPRLDFSKRLVHGRFTTLAISKWPNILSGRFKTSLGFEMVWPFFQNLSQQSKYRCLHR